MTKYRAKQRFVYDVDGMGVRVGKDEILEFEPYYGKDKPDGPLVCKTWLYPEAANGKPWDRVIVEEFFERC